MTSRTPLMVPWIRLSHVSRAYRATPNRPLQGHVSRQRASTATPVASNAATIGTLPLEGYRVLDMTRVLAGPYCTQILGDLGAEVIKIEHPVRGDDTRAWGPPYATYTAKSGRDGPGESAYFLGVNRNKKSLGLSFQHPEGVEILQKLAAKCDILVENYLPGTLKKYGLDFETIHKINPGLIYASITGYGQTGPYSPRAGYDVMVEAEFGLMHITGSRDGPPVKVGVAVTDLTTGLYTSNSIMAAILTRAKTGRGQHIDSALSDCQTATLANIASSCLISGQPDTGRWGTAHPSIVPYRSFKTKDGDVLFGGGNDRLYGILCQGIQRPEWIADPKFVTNAQRVAHRTELEQKIEEITVTKTTQEWLEIFEGRGMPYAAVNDVKTALNHEHTKARNMVVEVEHEQCGPIKLVNTPIKLSETPPTIRSPPPLLGQHTEELCHEPEIDDSLIQHENSSWSCAKCTAERSRLVGPKRIKFISGNASDNGNKRRLVCNSDLKKTISIDPPTRDAIPDSMRVSWADHSAGQKLAYLSTLSGGELVQLLIRSTELHPDLPIFPPTTKPMPAQPPVIDHTLRNDSQSNTGSYRKAKAVLGTQIDPDEEDPTGLMDAWPQPGQGLYAALCPDGDDETLVDDNDYDTFSHIIYDNNGRKARENGMALLVQ
ncbi:caib baif family enzyme [Grosmannia clavigera kw1407]|uniref:Caib baif family enzyme n=1 Tax=Grosmannia clavigera (strain kw1407 / UAMH 11150) TaxID=655863 RepID=F0XL30_GROCL|nr:caib baif family enzyme [Grosmannia clavigera kw1407]EFX01767.1 caib baif family enzyme [Grosmannia clavigera kw1407]